MFEGNIEELREFVAERFASIQAGPYSWVSVSGYSASEQTGLVLEIRCCGFETVWNWPQWGYFTDRDTIPPDAVFAFDPARPNDHRGWV